MLDATDARGRRFRCRDPGRRCRVPGGSGVGRNAVGVVRRGGHPQRRRSTGRRARGPAREHRRRPRALLLRGDGLGSPHRGLDHGPPDPQCGRSRSDGLAHLLPGASTRDSCRRLGCRALGRSAARHLVGGSGGAVIRMVGRARGPLQPGAGGRASARWRRAMGRVRRRSDGLELVVPVLRDDGARPRDGARRGRPTPPASVAGGRRDLVGGHGSAPRDRVRPAGPGRSHRPVDRRGGRPRRVAWNSAASMSPRAASALRKARSNSRRNMPRSARHSASRSASTRRSSSSSAKWQPEPAPHAC